MSQPESVPQPKSPESKLVAFGKEIYGIWISERPTQFAAALAYYAIFSFVPVIYITFTITELVIERLSVAETFYTRIANLLGAEIAQALQEAVTGLAEKTAGDTTLTTIIGFVALVFTASMTFVQLQRTLNTIWKVPPPSRGQNRAYVLNRLLAFAMVLGVALLFIVAAAANTLISLVNAQVQWGGFVSISQLFRLGRSGGPDLRPALQSAAQRKGGLAARVGWGRAGRAPVDCRSISGQALPECQPVQLGP